VTGAINPLTNPNPVCSHTHTHDNMFVSAALISWYQWSGVCWLVCDWIELVSEFVSWLNNRWCSVVVSCCCEKLVIEVRNSSRIQSKGNVRRWKPLLGNNWWRHARLRRLKYML
jgi:hypothetical protein